MHRLVFAPGLLLAAALGSGAASQAMVPTCAAGARCGFYDQELVQREGAAQRAALERVWAMLARGEATPEADARAAADAGNFRLIWSSGFGSLAVSDGHCRFPLTHPESRRAPFTLFERSFSDAIDNSERGRAEVEAGRRLDDYALRYNRTIRADPRFPYPDLCAVQVQTRRLRGLPGLHQPDSLAPSARIETDAPRNFGEAVRRGTLRAVRRMLAGIGPAALDQRDDFGLTPLAWAVIDNRPDVARLLLARGADPLGGCAAPWDEMEALPLGLALAKGQRALVDAMLTPAVRARLQPWPRALVLLAARGNHEALLREMLAAPDAEVNIGRVLDAVMTSGSPALRRHIARSSPGATATFLQLAVWRADPALLREALALRPPLGADSHGRRSPLGNAVVTESSAVDENVRLLLAAGAPVDSPADWGRDGFQVGSPVPTALFALTAYALRTDSARPRAEDAPRIAAERRALDLLLAAGASVRGTDNHGRPLAVVLVTGRFGAAMAMPYPLPAGWLDRLVQAGMDVNAPWRGSTALDWAEAAGMTDAARELERAGGRRLRPATRREGRLN